MLLTQEKYAKKICPRTPWARGRSLKGARITHFGAFFPVRVLKKMLTPRGWQVGVADENSSA